MSSKIKTQGFSLIGLAAVLAIIVMLIAAVLPKWQGFSRNAKEISTKSTLKILRSALAVKYAQSAAGAATAAYPSSLDGADFAGGREPRNAVSGNEGVEVLVDIPSGTAVSAKGFWYIPTGLNAGRAGAFSDGTTDTGGY